MILSHFVILEDTKEAICHTTKRHCQQQQRSCEKRLTGDCCITIVSYMRQWEGSECVRRTCILVWCVEVKEEIHIHTSCSLSEEKLNDLKPTAARTWTKQIANNLRNWKSRVSFLSLARIYCAVATRKLFSSLVVSIRGRRLCGEIFRCDKLENCDSFLHTQRRDLHFVMKRIDCGAICCW